MEIGYLQEVKAIIKSLVVSCPNAITIDKLNRDFKDIEGLSIPYTKLGFSNLESFLRSISDSVKVNGGGPNATVQFVPNEKSDHIYEMICQQKKSRKSRSKYNSQYGNKIKSSFRSPSYNDSITNTYSSLASRSRPNSNKYGVQDYLNSKFQHARHSENAGKINRFKYSDRVLHRDAFKKTETLLPIQSPIKSRIQSTVKNRQADSNNISPQIKSSLPTNSKTVQIEELNNLFQKKVAIANVENKECTSSYKKAVTIVITEKKEQPLQSETVPETVAKPNNRLLSSNIKNTRISTFLQNSDNENRLNDLDEAIPEFAANNLVFRVDFPENTVVFGTKIAHYTLPSHLKCGSIIGMFVSEIHSPFKFWFHIYKENNEFDHLMLQIELFYKNLDSEEFCIPPICITPGQVCAALYNDNWYRAEVISQIINSKVKVLFVDYGTVSDVHIDDIKYLRTKYASIPTQAVRGCLSHIKPRGLHWRPESTSCFLSMATDQMLYGQVTEIDESNRVVYSMLCNTNGIEDILINKTLIEKGFGLFDEEWKESNIQKSGQRRRHLREDFPTFAMIEMGEYPSFIDIVDLQHKGIDYERIIDRLLFHPCKLNHHENAPDVIRNLPFQLLSTNPFRREIVMQLNGYNY